MNEILQIIGSVASIAGIPLAIYLFLRSQEQKYVDVRKDIVNRLSFQIGEGRQLSIFEVQAMISSKVRQNRIRYGLISTDQVVEDLVTEIINSPLLESNRKEEVITQLRELHSLGKLYRLVSADSSIFEKFSLFLKQTTDQPEESEQLEVTLAEDIKDTKKNEEIEVSQKFLFLTVLMSLIVAIVSSLVGASEFLSSSDFLSSIYKRVQENEIEFNVLVGFIISIISVFFVFYMTDKKK